MSDMTISYPTREQIVSALSEMSDISWDSQTSFAEAIADRFVAAGLAQTEVPDLPPSNTTEKAIVLREGPNGEIQMLTLLRPTLESRGTNHNAPETALSGRLYQMTVWSKTENFQAREDAAVAAYVEAEADYARRIPLPSRASDAAIKEWMDERHRSAVSDVYDAGILQGLKSVEFRNPRVEAEIRTQALGEVVRTVRDVHYKKTGTKSDKGLKKALTALNALVTAASTEYRKTMGLN